MLVLVGLATGLLQVSLTVSYQAELPGARRGPATALCFGAQCLSFMAVALGCARLGASEPDRTPVVLGLLTLLAGGATLLSLRARLREVFELSLAILLLPLYRFRLLGPGVGHFPLRGPVIVVANHVAWMDPLWLGKVIPQKLTPLMASKFYDLPILRWLMTRVVRAIRVAESTYRQDAPELEEAVARLDAGECVVLFPEGSLRRDEEKLLRPFRQGVWRILQQRPQTPVVACWIEGGWGSYFSHRNGPPGRGKPFDWFRRITIVMGQPEVLPADLLADQRKTRHYLTDQVRELRHHLPAEKAPMEGAEAPQSPQAL
jgi:1-acyl-sn-glycerol-3-phosphate acyltransferase